MASLTGVLGETGLPRHLLARDFLDLLLRLPDDSSEFMHRRLEAPASEAMVAGKRVTCPLHGWNIGLADGQAVAPDRGCTGKVACKVEEGHVYLRL